MKSSKFNDVESDYDGIFLRYYHYTRNNAHIYMFSNEDINNEINTKLKLSAFEGGKYIEYDAFENTAVVKESDSEIELNLPSYHSRLIIFGEVDFNEIPKLEETKVTEEKIFNLEYKISVAERNSEEFKHYKTTDKLFNITGRNELPDFSGHIKYETEFEAESGNYILDLGYVGEVAELYINDKFVGEKLFPPYKFEVSDFIQNGKNKMTVIVSNHNGFAVKDMFSKFLLFEPSGLLEDIRLKRIETGK